MREADDRPVVGRDDRTLPAALPRGAEIPDDLDPLADGILMKHQADWLADDSNLKLAEKGRRTGITFAEALDDTLIAAASREAGGDNVFYIGDTRDKGREFIGYVAAFARTVAQELLPVEEFFFIDRSPDGSSREISAFRVRFASGFRVEALSSRPENIRGLQGVVVIDEAAFHADVRAVIDAVNALLIWGGKIRVISTHNGLLNPFYELIREARAGRNPFSLHFIPFSAAVENGLFRRVCLVRGAQWSPEAEAEWEATIRAAYGPRTAAMRQELDAIPAEAEGAALTRVQIEACMEGGIPVVRWRQLSDFKDVPERTRKAAARDFCEAELAPLLDRLDPARPHYFGEDFARSGDITCILPLVQQPNLTRRAPFVVELRNVPFDQQREILFFIVDRLPRLSGGALDAAGNGAYLAEKAAQRYGERIVEIRATRDWYRVHGTAYVEAISDRTIVLPRDENILRDHQALAYIDGAVKVPVDHRIKDDDGYERHGDSAIAGMLAWHASTMNPVEYGYRPARPAAARTASRDFDIPDRNDDVRAGWTRPPLGARIRGGGI